MTHPKRLAPHNRKGVRRRVICLSTYPVTDASTRLRVLQYRDGLAKAGWELDLEVVISPRLYALKNKSGWQARGLKAVLLLAGLARRMFVVSSRLRRYDAVWIHREAFPFLTPLAERIVRRLARGPVLLDIDDAVYTDTPVPDWRRWLRDPAGYPKVIPNVDVVLAGSPELETWAIALGADTRLVPTCVDTRVLQPAVHPTFERVTVGWIGSHSTTGSLLEIQGPLRRAVAQHGVRLVFVGAFDLESVRSRIPEAEWRPWTLAGEVTDLQDFDIGIMPLADTSWNRGKCAFKLVQYMSVGIPFLTSPVGMNTMVAEVSGGGWLCSSDDDWVSAIGRLASDRRLRVMMGEAGRRYAVRNYDYRSQLPVILDALDLLHEGV